MGAHWPKILSPNVQLNHGQRSPWTTVPWTTVPWTNVATSFIALTKTSHFEWH